jgi:methylmalonyl-CoA/ethylmalonyl-CoA epimerase
MIRANLPGRGKVIQLAFVPKDFDAALRFWIEKMGVGPFYMLEHLPYENVLYRGKPISIDVSVALGYWGDLQIELIRQHTDDVISGYTESSDIRREGLHHVLVTSDDVDGLHEAWLKQGAVNLMTGTVPGCGRFIYLDVGDGGPHVELVHLEPQFWMLFDYMHRQAAKWDGKDPIRAVPDPSEWSR